MPLPFFYHLGNTGGLSFARALDGEDIRADLLDLNSPEELERLKASLTPAFVAGLTFAKGHQVYLAEPWIHDRYDMTLLRWPLAVFSAQAVYGHEKGGDAGLPAAFAGADHATRLGKYLDLVEEGHRPAFPSIVDWLDRRHRIGLGDPPMRDAYLARLDRCDALLSDFYRLVGITELIDESLFLFHADLPHHPLRPWVRVRVVKQQVDHLALPAAIAARFNRLFAADVALYERARQRLLARFAALWRERPDLRAAYVDYKTDMILTDPLLMAKFAETHPLYFPPELPLDELRAGVMAKIGRAVEIRGRILRAEAHGRG